MRTTIRDASPAEAAALRAAAAGHYRCTPADVFIGSVCTEGRDLFGQVFNARNGLYLGLECLPIPADGFQLPTGRVEAHGGVVAAEWDEPAREVVL